MQSVGKARSSEGSLAAAELRRYAARDKGVEVNGPSALGMDVRNCADRKRLGGETYWLHCRTTSERYWRIQDIPRVKQARSAK